MPAMEGQICVDMYGDLPLGAFVLTNATLRGEEGYIFTRNEDPILEQNADFLRKGKFLKPRLREEHRTLRTVREVDDLVSLVSRCGTGFFHWMMDSLPKVVIAERCGFTGSYLIPAPTTAPWAEESLTLLGISPTRVIHHSTLDTRAQRLLIPTYFSGYNAHHNKSFMMLYREALRQAIPVHERGPRERILIARAAATKVRRIINDEEVRKTCAAFGFRTISFEELPLREQIRHAISAKAMLGAHGSGLCHSLFMDEGSTLIELFPFRRVQSCDCYEMIATIPHHRYHALESVEGGEGDIIVPRDELRSLLQRGLKDPPT
jgi:hypothetical protein